MIKIDLLKNHSDAIDLLAQIGHQVLGRIWVTDISIERVKQRFAERLNDDSIPLTFIALFNDKPIGMCSLRENDGIRPDLMPWLGSLVVDPDYQKQGIAEKLINATKEKAKQLAATKSPIVGLGVGLYDDYGNAQKMYIKKGYIPDGYGVTYNYQPVIPGDRAPIDDDLVLWFTKDIS